MKTEQQELFPTEKPDALQDIMADYIIARKEHEELDAKKKKAYRDYKAAESKLVEQMIEKGVVTQKMGNGVTFSLKKFVDFKVNEANFDEVIGWLVQRGQVEEEFISEGIRKARLREFLKDYIEENGILDIPESMDVSQRPNLSVLKWKEVYGQ